MPRSLPSVHFTDAQDMELAEYRYLPGQVAMAIIFGLLSPLALVDLRLMFIPLLGVFLGVWALRRIKKNPTAMTGRKRALFGIALSLVFLAAAPADAVTAYRMINRQAREIADAWFQLVLDNRLLDARRLMLVVKKKDDQSTPAMSPVEMAARERAEKASPGKSDLEHEVDELSKRPVIQSLLYLGPAARVRFYQTELQEQADGNDIVQLSYAVTYDDKGERKTFFVGLDVRRLKLSNDNHDWRIMNVAGGTRPAGI